MIVEPAQINNLQKRATERVDEIFHVIKILDV